MGHQKMWMTMQERDAIYAKSDFTEEDGIRAGELEGELGNGGYTAESDAAALLSDLARESLHEYLMKLELPGALKVRVLLAQALVYGNPDILILDEPTNDLDDDQLAGKFLADYENIVIVVSYDRHFLMVCTHVADVDRQKIKIFTGNYTFWYESSHRWWRGRWGQE